MDLTESTIAPEAWESLDPVASAGWDGNLRGTLAGTARIFFLADQMMLRPEGRAAYMALETECELAGMDVGRAIASAIGCDASHLLPDAHSPPGDDDINVRIDTTERLRRAWLVP
jgi:hypothetical protein